MKALRSVVALVILSIPIKLWPCSWAEGYFIQLTYLRGRVVGSNSKWINWSRRWRQGRGVSNAKITLYKYSHPWVLKNPVAEVKGDPNGRFDFGEIAKGHYTMTISGSDLSDAFDVEITEKAQKTKSVLIDISPVTPDCKGGHEFVVNSN